MTVVDLEAARQGFAIKADMTVDEATACCRAGYVGLNISPTTPGK